MDKKINIEYLSQIESYINGTLSEKEIDELWMEFLKNPELHEYFIIELHLQDMRRKGEFPSGLNKPDEGKVTEQLRTYHGWKYAAAAVILFVAILQIFQFKELSEQGLATLTVTYIDLSELAGADIYRSGNDAVPVTDVSINEGLAIAYEGNVDLAIQTFEDLLERELAPEQQARVSLNLGILFYNEGNYQEAVASFLSVTRLEESPGAITEKGWWFLGNSLLQTGDIIEAREAIRYTNSLNGRFQNETTELLDKLDAYAD